MKSSPQDPPNGTEESSASNLRPVIAIFGALTLIFGAMIAYFTWPAFQAWLNPTAQSNFERLWNEDLAQLARQKKLPKAWASIGEVEIVGANSETEGWLKRIHPLLPKTAGGQYKLEILVDNWADEESRGKGALVQYHLIEIASGNTVWERGRTFVFADSETSK